MALNAAVAAAIFCDNRSYVARCPIKRRRIFVTILPPFVVNFSSPDEHRLLHSPKSASLTAMTSSLCALPRLRLASCTLLILAANCAGQAVAPTAANLAPAITADVTLFKYDTSTPLEVREAGTEQRGAATVRDLSFVSDGERIKAYLVAPTAPGPHAAVLWVHWLGEPATTNRTEFLAEAVDLAAHGVVSVLVDTMWAKPKWYQTRVPEEDFATSIHQTIALRRAMDLLLAQPGADAKRVALVGHDFGAMYGALAGAADRRAKTYVFMTPTPHFIDWALFGPKPKSPEEFKAQLARIDPVAFVPLLAPASVFYQFGSTDNYVPAPRTLEFYAATGPHKQMATYVAGHDLHTPLDNADRRAWLMRELELK